MTTKTRSREDKAMAKLQAEANEAARRIRELEAESRSLPSRIKEAARAEARARAAARASGAVGELPRLREREASLPLELWGARIRSLETSLELSRAQLSEVLDQQHEARQTREQTELEFEQAKATYEEARSRHEGLAYRGQNLQGAMKTTERELVALEAEGPPA